MACVYSGFSSYCQGASKSGCSNLHFLQQRAKVPFVPRLFRHLIICVLVILSFPVGILLCMLLFCFSLMTKNFHWFLVYSSTIYFCRKLYIDTYTSFYHTKVSNLFIYCFLFCTSLFSLKLHFLEIFM